MLMKYGVLIRVFIWTDRIDPDPKIFQPRKVAKFCKYSIEYRYLSFQCCGAEIISFRRWLHFFLVLLWLFVFYIFCHTETFKLATVKL